VITQVIKSREEGGMFSVEAEEEHPEPQTQPEEDTGPDTLDPGIQMMEQRISLFESKIEDIAKKLDELSGKKDEKDAIIIELFKMLKQSMEARVSTVLHFARLNGKINKTPKKPAESKPERRPAFSLRLKRKK
jgi:hypothetical protein